MIHYFIISFEYNDHHEKCITHVHVEVMKPEQQKAKGAVRIIIFQLRGVILGTYYLILIMKYRKI
jgi:hypothetical protein